MFNLPKQLSKSCQLNAGSKPRRTRSVGQHGAPAQTSGDGVPVDENELGRGGAQTVAAHNHLAAAGAEGGAQGRVGQQRGDILSKARTARRAIAYTVEALPKEQRFVM